MEKFEVYLRIRANFLTETAHVSQSFTNERFQPEAYHIHTRHYQLFQTPTHPQGLQGDFVGNATVRQVDAA